MCFVYFFDFLHIKLISAHRMTAHTYILEYKNTMPMACNPIILYNTATKVYTTQNVIL